MFEPPRIEIDRGGETGRSKFDRNKLHGPKGPYWTRFKLDSDIKKL